MSQRTWSGLAQALARLRRLLAKHADRSRGAAMRRAHMERILGVDLAARVVCRTLRSGSSRFDGRRFMRLTRDVGVNRRRTLLR